MSALAGKPARALPQDDLVECAANRVRCETHVQAGTAVRVNAAEQQPPLRACSSRGLTSMASRAQRAEQTGLEHGRARACSSSGLTSVTSWYSRSGVCSNRCGSASRIAASSASDALAGMPYQTCARRCCVTCGQPLPWRRSVSQCVPGAGGPGLRAATAAWPPARRRALGAPRCSAWSSTCQG